MGTARKPEPVKLIPAPVFKLELGVQSWQNRGTRRYFRPRNGHQGGMAVSEANQHRHLKSMNKFLSEVSAELEKRQIDAESIG